MLNQIALTTQGSNSTWLSLVLLLLSFSSTSESNKQIWDLVSADDFDKTYEEIKDSICNLDMEETRKNIIDKLEQSKESMRETNEMYKKIHSETDLIK